MSGELIREKYLRDANNSSKYVLYISQLCENFLSSCSVDDLATMISNSTKLRILELIFKAYRCETLLSIEYEDISEYIQIPTYSEYLKSLPK